MKLVRASCFTGSPAIDMSPVTDNPVIAPDRELEEEKQPSESEPPRIRCPLCGWSPRKEDNWFCECGYSWHTFCISGLSRSASRAAVGRCIRTGMPSSSG